MLVLTRPRRPACLHASCPDECSLTVKLAAWEFRRITSSLLAESVDEAVPPTSSLPVGLPVGGARNTKGHVEDRSPDKNARARVRAERPCLTPMRTLETTLNRVLHAICPAFIL